jgi:membrane protease YdiL (CAAX protease family)
MLDFKQHKGQNTIIPKDSSPWFFISLTFGWSWLFWILAFLFTDSDNTLLTTTLRYIGGLGPLLSAIALVYLKQDKEGRRDYWRRVIDSKRIRAKWYAVIFLTVPALAGLAAMIDFISGGEGIRLEAAAQFQDQPLMIIPFVIFILLFGPIPEELGWRGYLLDRLQVRWSALSSSLILGIIWATWHLPFFS